MKNILFFIITSFFSFGVWAQPNLSAILEPNTSYNNIQLLPSGRINIFQAGIQPFHPNLIWQKLVLGHPDGIIGAGISQQYQPNPTEFWSAGQMLPRKGVPQYPLYVLGSTSPALSAISPKGTAFSFSAGQLNRGGYMPEFRKIKVVKGFRYP